MLINEKYEINEVENLIVMAVKGSEIMCVYPTCIIMSRITFHTLAAVMDKEYMVDLYSRNPLTVFEKDIVLLPGPEDFYIEFGYDKLMIDDVAKFENLVEIGLNGYPLSKEV